MKKILFSTLLALLMIPTAILSLNASAASPTPTASLEYVNIAYAGDKMHLAFTLDYNVYAGQSVGIAVWLDDEDGLMLKSADATDFSPLVDPNGRLYYNTPQITMEHAAQRIFIAPVINLGDRTMIAEKPTAFSLFDYAICRLDDEGVTEAQLASYMQLLENEDVKNPNFSFLKITDGKKSYYSSVPEKKSVSLRAEAKNAEGKYFLYWDTNGTKTSSRFITIGDEAGKFIVTATYGDRENSPYANSYDFESHEIGEMEVSLPADIDPLTYYPKLARYENGYYWQLSGKSGGITYYDSFKALGKDLPFLSEYVSVSDSHSIVADDTGDSYLLINKRQDCIGAADMIKSPAIEGTVSTAMEADINILSGESGAFFRLNVYFTLENDGSISPEKLIQITPTFKNDTVYFYIESSERNPSAECINSKTVAYKIGSSGEFCLRYELATVDMTDANEQTASFLALNIFLDGELITETPLVTKYAIDEDTVTSISSANISFFAKPLTSITVDNLTFFDEENRVATSPISR